MAWPEHMETQVFSVQSMHKAEVAEDYVIGKAGHGLHFAADEQCVLMRDEETAVVSDLGPAAHGEKSVVERAVFFVGSRHGFNVFESFGESRGSGVDLFARLEGFAP